jgi:hypothetical protein
MTNLLDEESVVGLGAAPSRQPASSPSAMVSARAFAASIRPPTGGGVGRGWAGTSPLGLHLDLALEDDPPVVQRDGDPTAATL